jgi:hypothetical protein
MESAFSPLKFKRAMVTVIVIEPEPEKNHGDEHAINHSGGGEFEHRTLCWAPVGVGRKPVLGATPTLSQKKRTGASRCVERGEG